MTLTNNLFIRDDLADTGQVPSGARLYWISPDIIPNGLDAVPDPQATFGSSASYAMSPGKDILPEQQNYIYLRAKNLYQGGAANGRIALYWCKSSLLMNTGLWSDQQIPAVTGGETADISAAKQDDIAVAESAFRWLAPQQPHGFHYCLVARLMTGTPEDPNPIPPNFPSCGAFSSWVMENAQVAYRNVYINNTAAPSRQFAYHFSNPDPTDEQFIIAADSYNMPVGTEISFSCAATGPQPAIKVSGQVRDSSQSFTTVPTTVPGDFEGDLVVTIDCPLHVPIPSNSSVKMRYYRVENPSNENDQLMDQYLMPPARWGLMDDVADGRVVRLGETMIEYVQ